MELKQQICKEINLIKQSNIRLNKLVKQLDVLNIKSQDTDKLTIYDYIHANKDEYNSFLKKVNECIKNIDWDRLYNIMKCDNWVWGIFKNNSHVPSIAENKKFLRQLILQSKDCKDSIYTAASGGWEVCVSVELPSENELKKIKDFKFNVKNCININVKFIFTGWNTECYNNWGWNYD